MNYAQAEGLNCISYKFFLLLSSTPFIGHDELKNTKIKSYTVLTFVFILHSVCGISWRPQQTKEAE